MNSLEEDLEMFRKLPEVIEEFKNTQHPHLRVLTGGKGPPDLPNTNWLSELPVRTQFACRLNNKTVDWEMYFLYHKISEIYLLKWEMPDGNSYDRRVDPAIFSNMYRDYRVLGHYPLPELEAPEGDDIGPEDKYE